MFNKKIPALILSMLLMISAFAVPISAQAANDLTVIGKLAAVEQAVYGATQTGAVTERLSKIEEDVYGSTAQEALLPRVDKLYAYAFDTTEQAPSILTKLNVVEWTLTHGVSDSSVKARIENIEKTLNGNPGTGSLNERLTKLLNLAYTGGHFEVVSSIITKDTLIKVKTLSTLSSKQSRAGDTVALDVAEDVYIGGVLILPKGATGKGKVVKVNPSKNFGRDAKLEISFDNVYSIDGTAINTYMGEKAKEETKSMAKAAGASVAGMVVLGPVGIIGGAFISGKDVEIPIGSQMYIQTKEDVEVYGVRVK